MVHAHVISWLSPAWFGLVCIAPAVSLLPLAWLGPQIATIAARPFCAAVSSRKRALYSLLGLAAGCLLLAELGLLSQSLGRSLNVLFLSLAFWAAAAAGLGIEVVFAVIIIDCVSFAGESAD
jgi:hypothetical protein